MPTALAHPPLKFLRGYAACLSVSQACKGSNANNNAFAVEYQSLNKHGGEAECGFVHGHGPCTQDGQLEQEGHSAKADWA